MTPVEMLSQKLSDMKVTSFNVFPGTKVGLTPNEIAKEVLRSLDQLEAGNFEEVQYLD